MPYITKIGPDQAPCDLCLIKRVPMTSLPKLYFKDGKLVQDKLTCCQPCYDWMIDRGYPVAELLVFAKSWFIVHGN